MTPQYEILEGEIVNDPPPPTHPIFVFVICPPPGQVDRVGGEKRRPDHKARVKPLHKIIEEYYGALERDWPAMLGYTRCYLKRNE